MTEFFAAFPPFFIAWCVMLGCFVSVFYTNIRRDRLIKKLMIFPDIVLAQAHLINDILKEEPDLPLELKIKIRETIRDSWMQMRILNGKSNSQEM